ncbi:MAG: catalase-related domain-containing protein, partial [bacterium]
CPMQNFQRDGIMRMEHPTGRVAYEPNSLDPAGPREHPAGFTSHASEISGEKTRVRAETFADHYSQARLFWRSMTEPEQRHIAGAFAFELGKVETVAIRKRMLGHLAVIDSALCGKVEIALGMVGEADKIEPLRAPIALDPSPALSQVRKFVPTLAGRKVGVLITDGVDRALLDRLRSAVEKEGGSVEVIAPTVGGVSSADRKPIAVDHRLVAAPSIFYDAVVLAPSDAGAKALAGEAAAIDWLRDAFGHLKVIGHVPAAAPLLALAGVKTDAGVVAMGGPRDVAAFVTAAKGPRIWAREPSLRS